MRCSVKKCENQGEHRVILMTAGIFAGHRARLRVQLPLVACSAHRRPGAFWASTLRVVPRTFAALLANCGIALPRLHHTRVRFVPLGTARAPQRVPATLRLGAGLD